MGIVAPSWRGVARLSWLEGAVVLPGSGVCVDQSHDAGPGYELGLKVRGELVAQPLQTLFAVVRRAVLPILPALLLVPGLTGCRTGPVKLTVPIADWPGYEYFYLAQQRGLDHAEGLSLDVVEFPDPQTIVHAYLRGELPLAQLTTVEAVDLCARAPDRCPVVVLVLDESRGGDQLLARPGISSLSQLRGKRVGVLQSSLGPFLLSRALEREGMSLADVKLSNVPLTAMPAALARGDLDAATLFPPYSEEATRQARATRLFDSSRIPGEIFDILVVDPQQMPALRDTLPRLLRVWQAAHELRRKEPGPTTAVMGRREHLSPAAFRDAEGGLRYFSLVEQRSMLAPAGPLARNLQAVRRVQQQLRLVSPSSPLPRVTNEPITAALR